MPRPSPKTDVESSTLAVVRQTSLCQIDTVYFTDFGLGLVDLCGPVSEDTSAAGDIGLHINTRPLDS